MITEFPHRNTLAYLFTADNRLAIVGRDYSVHKTTVEYNPYRQGLTIIGDMFYYTVKVADTEEEHYYALDASTYKTVDDMVNRYADDTTNLSEYIFPFKVSFTSYNDGWVLSAYRRIFPKGTPIGTAACHPVSVRGKTSEQAQISGFAAGACVGHLSVYTAITYQKIILI